LSSGIKGSFSRAGYTDKGFARNPYKNRERRARGMIDGEVALESSSG